MSQYFSDFVSIAATQVEELARDPLAMLQIVVATAPLEVLIHTVLLARPAAALGHPTLGAGTSYRVCHGRRRERMHKSRFLVELFENVAFAARLDRTVPAIVTELILTVGGGQASCLTQCAGQTRLLAALMILAPCGWHITTGTAHLTLRCENGHDCVLRNEMFAVNKDKKRNYRF